MADDKGLVGGMAVATSDSGGGDELIIGKFERGDRSLELDRVDFEDRVVCGFGG